VFVDALVILGLALARSQGPHTDATRETRLRYTVQIQSAPAAQRDRLHETYEALKAKGHLVYCRDAWVHGRAYVQLQVGLFPSSEEAGRYGETIRDCEGFDCFVARANLPVESFGMAFDIIAAANDIWFRSDTCLRPLYHFDTAEASTTCSGIAISPTGRCIAFSCDNKIVKLDLQVGSTTVLKTGPCDDSLFNSVLAWSPDGRHIAYLDAVWWELPTKLWITQSDGNEIHYQLAHFDAQCQVRQYTAHKTAIPR